MQLDLTEPGKKSVKIVVKDGKAHMLSPYGVPTLVEKDEIDSALRQGYTIETAEAVHQRQVKESEAKEKEQYYTFAAVIGGILVLVATFKFLRFLGMRGTLMLVGAIVLVVAFFGAFGFFGQLFAGGLVLVLLASHLMGTRTIVVVDERLPRSELPERRKKRRKVSRSKQTTVTPPKSEPRHWDDDEDGDYEDSDDDDEHEDEPQRESTGTTLWLLFIAIGVAFAFAML